MPEIGDTVTFVTEFGTAVGTVLSIKYSQEERLYIVTVSSEGEILDIYQNQINGFV